VRHCHRHLQIRDKAGHPQPRHRLSVPFFSFSKPTTGDLHMTLNHQIVLDNRPVGEATTSNFKLIETQPPALKDNQVLVRHHYLSLDPYMRGRMNESKSYAVPQPLGEVMIGGTVGEVVESRHPKFNPGDKVVGMGGWQLYSVVDGNAPGMLRRVDTTHVPLSHYLGAVGMPGVTAWYGLVKIINPKAGETVTVSAASGAVGSAYGALAKARGCRVVGIAGGKDKCDYVVNELGFDACIDYKEHKDYISLSKALREACPNGIDGHFENVGGMVLDAVMLRTNAFARIAVCGMIAGYDGAPIGMTNPALILVNRMKIEGFIVSEHMEVWPEALHELGTLVGTGKLRPRESVAEGLAAAPEAFLGLLKGKNFGKQLVKLI
jgi:NADPH-dependent curcumin reductase CurA